MTRSVKMFISEISEVTSIMLSELLFHYTHISVNNNYIWVLNCLHLFFLYYTGIKLLFHCSFKP
jgi:hypothetical protein